MVWLSHSYYCMFVSRYLIYCIVWLQIGAQVQDVCSGGAYRQGSKYLTLPTNLLPTINNVYTDGPCVSKTLAGVFLARFEGVSHVTHFYK